MPPADGSGGPSYGSAGRLERDGPFAAALAATAATAVAYLFLGVTGGEWLTFFVAPAVLLSVTIVAALGAARATRRAPEIRFWRLIAGAFALWWGAVVFASPLGAADVLRELLADVAYGGFYTLLIVAVETRPHRRLDASTGPLEHRLMAPAAGCFVAGWWVYFPGVNAALELRGEEALVPSMLLFSLLDLYLVGRLALLATRSGGGWRRIYLLLTAAALGFLASDLFAAAQSAADLPWRWDRWPNVLWILPLVAVIGAARLSYGGPRSASPSPQSPIVRPLPTVTWALSFPVLHAALELTGWLAPVAHRPRELVVMVMVAILGAYAVVQRQLLVRHSLELWRQGRRVEQELKESEQDLLLMVARGHQRKALERHEQTYQKAFQASPDALVLTTWSDGRVLEVNQSFVDMLGTKREDVVGALTRDLPLWRDASVRRRVLDRVMAEGPVHFAELRLRSLDGGEQRVALSLAGFHPVE
ncbi:MAG: PAS domain-containing protein, partial [Acidobacteriota bacterium]